MNIDIIFEDEFLLIINKPAGITVNSSETTIHEKTLQDWANEKLDLRPRTEDNGSLSDFYKREGIVHRLDKETSGTLIIAKTEEAFLNLQQQFKDRVVKKDYIAFAHGKILPREGEINVPVGRLPWNRTQFGIVPGGRDSLTNYMVMDYYLDTKTQEILTLVKLFPQSGRTHQIRVHLKYIGHPIFSDFLYTGRKTSRKDRQKLPRVFLHAAGIQFKHPKTNISVSYTSDFPKELSDTLKLFSKLE